MIDIKRNTDIRAIQKLLEVFPIVIILGPRQVGKTTLAKAFQPDHHFDLENPRDIVRLANPQLALESLEGLIMIDEAHHKPDLFPLLRYMVDNVPNQRYMLLGSSSSNLKNQSGESLAGRVGYHHLSGFKIDEIGQDYWQQLWLNGGFPKSYLAQDQTASMLWRNNFIATFLESDLSILGHNVLTNKMYRLWIMVSHYHGRTVNYAQLARALDLSDKTIKNYLDILEETFMIRLLQPWYANVKKRLVKSPKVYIRDSGIFHALQGISTRDQLLTNPILGTSWEGFALEEVINQLHKRSNEVFFYAAHSGVEVDLFFKKQGKNIGIEFKYKDAPRTTKSMHQAIDDLALDHLYVVYPGTESYALTQKIEVVPLTSFTELI